MCNDLPPTVDPCGEYGEFHSFVFDGPIFSFPVRFKKGEIVFREYLAPTINNHDPNSDAEFQTNYGFYFCDLVPQQP